MRKVLLIGEDGDKLGNFTLEEAKDKARAASKDLQLVNAKENVYKITDIGKQKYQEKQRKKQQALQKRSHKVKEIQLKPLTEAHDLAVKSKRARSFLEKGMKTKVVMRFKGRQMANTSAAEQKFNNFISDFINSEVATIDKPVGFQGRDLVAFLNPLNKGD